jgi:diguanylate cyclase (GGDEF)-like protein/putative nucleotidyltransferase with HDIG domain
MLVTWLVAMQTDSVVRFDTGVVVMLGVLIAISPAAYHWGPAWPAWYIHVLCASCVCAITYGILGVSGLTVQIAGLYVIVVLYASYYLPRMAGLGVVVLSTACFAGALTTIEPGPVPAPAEIASWLPIVGTIAITGTFLTSVRRTREGLVRRHYELKDKLELTARTDTLTGLLNRRAFERRATAVLEEHPTRSLALIVGDVDMLKAVNEEHGPAAGDRALLRIAEVITRSLRRFDVVGRTGGEEFAILATTAEVSDAVAVAERLRRDVMVGFGDEPFSLTMSFGVAIYPRDGETLDALLVAADRALLTAKRAGRNRTMLAAQAAGPTASLAVANRDEAERARLVTAIGLAEALDLRDTGTASHSQTVARYAALVARELGFDDTDVERIRMAGLLHDIGKIGVPDTILNKPGKLSTREYAEMQRHPEIGARILGSDVLDDVRGWVLAHHERPDGLGYPFGLSGDQVPLQARILAVADAYEAMTTDRVYREALPKAAARAELERCRGTQFDPRVIDAFLALLDRLEDDGTDAEDLPAAA